LELAGNDAHNKKLKRIQPSNIKDAIRSDSELDILCKDVCFASSNNSLGIPYDHIKEVSKKEASKKAKIPAKKPAVAVVPAPAVQVAKAAAKKQKNKRDAKVWEARGDEGANEGFVITTVG
jgi:hypothetical protein